MKINIGSMKYELVKDSSKPEEECSEIALGSANYLDATITVLSGLDKQVVKQTLWHEIVHVMLNEIGKDKLNNDEGFVDALAKQIYSVLENNNLEKIYKEIET